MKVRVRAPVAAIAAGVAVICSTQMFTGRHKRAPKARLEYGVPLEVRSQNSPLEHIAPVSDAIPYSSEPSAIASASAIAPLSSGAREESPCPNVLSADDLGRIAKISEAFKISVSDLVDAAAIAVANGISAEVSVEVLALAVEEGIPLSILKDLFSMPYASSLSATEIKGIASISATYEVSLADLLAIYRIASAGTIGSDSMAQIMAICEVSKIPLAAVSKAIEIALSDPWPRSRFDMVQPDTFSLMWEIKRRAKIAEAKGENTDALWKEYLDLLLKHMAQDPE